MEASCSLLRSWRVRVYTSIYNIYNIVDIYIYIYALLLPCTCLSDLFMGFLEVLWDSADVGSRDVSGDGYAFMFLRVGCIALFSRAFPSSLLGFYVLFGNYIM